MFNPSDYPALVLDQRAIETANNLSQWDAGNALAREAERIYREGLISFSLDYDSEVWNEQQQMIAEERATQWKELCEKAYNDIIHRRASWVPWTVAGPAKYNSRKNSAKADAQIKAEQEWHEKQERFIANTRDMIRNAAPIEAILEEYRSGKRQDPISSDDPAALEKLQARIDGIRERHEKGKAENAWWRKHGTMKGFPGVDDEKAKILDESINKLPPVFRMPYTVGSATATANIRRLEQRITEIKQAREKTITQEEHKKYTVTVDERINILFDGKPNEAVRDVLKHNGFHWSPKNGVWTRKMTDNAMYSLQKIVVPALDQMEAEDAEQ